MSTAISLCDLTGNFVRPWLDAGHDAILVDPQHGVDRVERIGGGLVTKLACTVAEALPFLAEVIRESDVVFVAGFPPCTDMAVSGARWFETRAVPHLGPALGGAVVRGEPGQRPVGRVRQARPLLPPARLHRPRARGQLHEEDVPVDRRRVRDARANQGAGPRCARRPDSQSAPVCRARQLPQRHADGIRPGRVRRQRTDRTRGGRRMSPLEPCDYTCNACGLTTCRDDRPSPGEVDGICASCWETEADDRMRVALADWGKETW